MPRKEKPVSPPIDWAEFVEAVRLRELERRCNRPSQMLARHSQTWREPHQPRVPKWLGGIWLTAHEIADADVGRANLFDRMRRTKKKR